MISKEPNSAVNEFLTNGEALYNMGLLDELIMVCREFLEKTDDDRVYAMLSSAEFSLGDIQAAEKSVRAGLLIKRDNPDLLYNLACILQHKGLLSNAIRYYLRTKKVCDAAGYDNELSEICQNEISKLEKILGKTENELMPPKAKKNVLIIAAIYPPKSGPGAQRTVKLVKNLRFFGWEPTIVTMTDIKLSSSGYEFFDELPDDVDVIRIRPRIIKEQSDFENVKNSLSPLLSNATREKYLHYYKTDIENRLELCSFPEPLILWAIDVADSICEDVDINKFGVIYSTSGPYSNHFAAYYIKQKNEIPWVADFRDEWSNNPMLWPDKTSFLYQMCLDCEQAVFRSADSVIQVTERSFDNTVKLGVQADKLACITNGYDEEDFEWLSGNSNLNEKFTIVHNGSFYPGRSTITALVAINNLINRGELDKDKILFHQGHTTTASEEEKIKNYTISARLEGVALINPQMEHHSSLVLAASADLLLLLLGESADYSSTYPGKIFEYLRLDKPILCLGPHGSISDHLLNRTGHGITVDYSDIAAIEKEILRHYNLWLDKDIGTPLLNQSADITMYERKHLTSKHAVIFDKIAGETENRMMEYRKS